MSAYQVVCGNIGTVYDGNNQDLACRTYEDYVSDSKRGIGRAAGEDVCLFRSDGSILFEYQGTLTQSEQPTQEWDEGMDR
jgi:hypothetical protein